MLLFIKLALVTCAFYLGINLILYCAFLALATWMGGAGFFFARSAQYLFFGLIWLASFSLAWRITMTPVLSKIPR